MITLDFNNEECTILIQLLDSCIQDLHEEITRTENLEYKEMLKQRKATLKKLFAILEQYLKTHMTQT